MDTLTAALAYGIFALKVAPIKLKSSARELFEVFFFFKDRSSDYEVLLLKKARRTGCLENTDLEKCRPLTQRPRKCRPQKHRHDLEMLSVVMAWLRDEDLRSLSTLTSTAGALVADQTDAGETGP